MSLEFSMMLGTLTTIAALAACACAHDGRDQKPLLGPHKGLWYNTLPGDGGTQVNRPHVCQLIAHRYHAIASKLSLPITSTARPRESPLGSRRQPILTPPHRQTLSSLASPPLGESHTRLAFPAMRANTTSPLSGRRSTRAPPTDQAHALAPVASGKVRDD
jgi:hypothetical protein